MIDPSIYRMHLQAGLYSRIARDLGLQRSHVRRVALGERRSARVQAALDAEISRIEQAVKRQLRKARKAA